MGILQALRIVVASPTDVQAERKALNKIADELNQGIAKDRGLVLQVWRWETSAFPSFHPKGPQGVIDKILRIEDCDILIGIFWKRFGTPVSDARSGTEHEFRIAYKTWKKHSRPQIMVYFNQKSYRPTSKAEADQWGMVLEFQKQFPKEGMWWPYKGNNEFETLARNHLTQYIRDRYPTSVVDPSIEQARIPHRPDCCLGRDKFVADLVRTMLEPDPRPALVLGGPGMGKSTICLEALHNDEVKRRYSSRRFFVRCGGLRSSEALMMKIALALGLHETDLGTGIRDAIKKPVFDKLKQSPAVLVLVRVEAPFFTDREGVRECLADLSEIPGLALIVSMEGKVSPRGINWSPPMILPPLELEDARKVFLKVASDISPAAPFLDELLEETACIPLAVELIARVAKVHKFLELVLGLLKESKEVWAKEVWAELDAVIEVSINSPPMKDCPKRLLGLLAVLPDGIAVSDLEMLLPGCGIREEEHTLVGAGLAIEDEVDQHRRVYMRTPVRKSVMRQDPPLPLLADDLERAIKHYVELAATFGPMYGRKGGAAAVDRITPELANLEEMLLQGLDQPDPMPSIAAAQRVTDIILHSGRGTSRVLKKACEVAEKRGQKLDWADCCTRLGDIARFWSQHDSAQTWYGKALGLYEELEGCDLRLMSSVNDVNSIPTEGKNLIIVANVQDVLHFRAFAADGKRVVDTDESQLPDQAPQIAKLKTLLSGLWGVPELPQSDKAKVISAVTSIVGHTQDLEQTKLNDEKLKKTRCMHAYCVQMLGQVALLRSMYNPAIGNFTDAKKLYIELGDKNGVADCIKGLGDAVRERSDQSALQYYKEACDLSRQEGYDLGLANSTQGMADIYLAKGGKDEVRSASSYYERAEGLYRRVGDYLGLANCIKGKGDAALNLEQFDDAERFYKQAAEYYLSLKNAVCEANLHKAFGDLALARGPERYEEAADEYKQALNKYEGTGNIRGKALCTKSLAEVYLKKGDYHLSEELFDEAWKNFEELNIINQMAACIKQLGDIALKRDKDTEKARERYLKALPDYERVGDILGRAYCLNSLGDLALASEPPQDAEAKKYYGMASQLFQEKGQRDYEADTLLRLGEIGLKQGELDPAKDHLDKALSLYEELGHQNGEAHCVKSLAEVHLKKGDYNRSERLFEDARKRFDEMNIINQKAACIKQLGDIALKRDRDIGKARQRYLEALSLHEQAGDTEGSAYCVNSLGDLESACEPPHDADAKKYYEEASRLFHEKRNRDYEARTLLRLGEMELKEGDVDPARKHLRMALSLYRRVGDQTGIDNVQGLLTRIASGIAG